MTDYEMNELFYCAFMYALGRKTYIVSTVAEILIKYKEKVHPDMKQIIRKRIMDALERDKAGMYCDESEWIKVWEALG